MPENTIVTLTVDTENITQTNINQTCVFTDNQGNVQDPGDPKGFIADVHADKEILWQGVARDGTTHVRITAIDKLSGPDIMLNVTRSGPDCKADIRTLHTSLLEDYSVTFQVEGKGEFLIDPKLRMKPRHSMIKRKLTDLIDLARIIIVDIPKQLIKIIFDWK